MKKKYNYFSHKDYWMHIIAGILIVCMLFVDASLYLSITSDNLPYANKGGNTASVSADDFVINENHLLDVAMADGEYSGRGSDYVDDSTGKHSYSVEEEVEGDDLYGIVNILEIVPDERMGFAGYTVGGCEPLGETDEEREWIMDAMANKTTGNDDYIYQVPYFVDEIESFWSGVAPSLTYKPGLYTGYFKKVLPGHGMYKLGNVTYSGDKVENVIMYSRFKSPNEVLNNGSEGYDYVWVESDKDSSGEYTQKSTYTTRAQLEAGEPIYLYDYKKIKYYNNEEFLCQIYPAKVQDSSGNEYNVDGEHGVYNTGNRYVMLSENTGNMKAVSLFKKARNSNGNRGIKIFTRTPAQLQEEENKDLIDNVDLIIIAEHGDSEYDDAYKLYNIANKGIKTDSFINNKNYYEYSNNDLNFEQVMKIYKRVVVEQNVAIVCSHLCLSESSSQGNMNIWKLMFLLYLVNSKTENDVGVSGSGQEFFKDFMETYKSDAPVIARARQTLDSSSVDLKACDFVKIDESTGNFIANDYYSGWYYEKVDGVGWPGDYPFIQFKDFASRDTSKWPTSIKDDWLLSGKGGAAYNQDGTVYNNTWWVTGFPLYKYYMYYYNQYYHGNDNTDGRYIPIDTPSFYNGYSKYKNQMLYNNQGRLFSLENGGADLLNSIIKDTPNKVTPSSSGGGTQTESVTKTAYMTMNIINGDSVNKVIGGNKVMYVNKYELDKTGFDCVPFDFEIRTTHPIDKMVLYFEGKESDPIATYTFAESNPEELGATAPDGYNYTYVTKNGGSGTGTLTKTLSTTTDKNPVKVKELISGVDSNSNIWKYKGTINEFTKNYFKNRKNTTVYFRVYSNLSLSGGDPMKATDSITVVTRDFFMLD